MEGGGGGGRVGAASRACPGGFLVIEGKTPPRAKPTNFLMLREKRQGLNEGGSRRRGARLAAARAARRQPPPAPGGSQRPASARARGRGGAASPRPRPHGGGGGCRAPARARERASLTAAPRRDPPGQACWGRQSPGRLGPSLVGDLGSKPRGAENPHFPPGSSGAGGRGRLPLGCGGPRRPHGPGPGRGGVRMTPRPNGAGALLRRSISI